VIYIGIEEKALALLLRFSLQFQGFYYLWSAFLKLVLIRSVKVLFMSGDY